MGEFNFHIKSVRNCERKMLCFVLLLLTLDTLAIFASPWFPLWFVDFPEINKFGMITQRFSLKEKPEPTSLDSLGYYWYHFPVQLTSFHIMQRLIYSFQFVTHICLTCHHSVKTLHTPLFIYMQLSNGTTMNLTSTPQTLDAYLRIRSYIRHVIMRTVVINVSPPWCKEFL